MFDYRNDIPNLYLNEHVLNEYVYRLIFLFRFKIIISKDIIFNDTFIFLK